MLASQTMGPLVALFSRPKLSWIIPDQIAAMALPAARDLVRLRRMGVTLLVSVISTPFHPDDLRKARLKYLHLPVMYLRSPSPEQIQAFVTAVRAELAAGGKVAVHCVGGLGRTGTVIACYLVEQGMTAQEAMTLVRRARPGSIESLEQENTVYLWAKERSARQAVAAIPETLVDEVAIETYEDDQVDDDEAGRYVVAVPELTEALSDEERMTPMTRVAQAGYLKWHPDGTGVDIRALSSGNGDCPKIENLKGALRELSIDNGTTVTLTETLGKTGEAWVSVSCSVGEQGALLITTGLIVNMLVGGNVYDEVLLSSE
jgi:atypical dual specificity phosphatase